MAHPIVFISRSRIKQGKLEDLRDTYPRSPS
jgi:hypothetical protein